MKTYKATLEIIYIKAKDKEQALEEFWEQVNEDGKALYVEVREMKVDV